MPKILERTALYLAGLFLLGLGINITKFADLGIAPVSSIAYAVELIADIGLGTASFIVYSLFIAAQILLLRRRFEPLRLLQIVTSSFFSLFITLSDRAHLLRLLPEAGNYWMRLLYVLIGIVITGCGVFLYMLPKLVPMPPDALVAAIVTVSDGRYEFHRVKRVFDLACASVGTLASLFFLGGFGAVREGTLLCAVGIGTVVGVLNRLRGKRLSAQDPSACSS